jgi:hypothetical protein
MSSSTRRVQQGQQPQGSREEVAYTLTTTPWGSSPNAVEVTVYDVTAARGDDGWIDVTSTTTSGAVSILGDAITTPLVVGLTPGSLYRIEIAFRTGAQRFVAWMEIRAER